MDAIVLNNGSVPTLSIVAPCFNEQQVLPEFLRRVAKVCAAVSSQYEIVLVDDGSRDGTWDIIVQAAIADARILGVRLRRNHGHQTALSAGLAASSGDLVLIIDADLQDPPELLPSMMEIMRSAAADVVYGQRRQRAGESAFKRVTALAFYRMLSWLSDTPIPRDTGDFRLLARPVVNLICNMREQHRFLRGMVAWVGGRQVPMMYDRAPRQAGITKYPFWRMMRFASDAITGFSRRPLQIATGLGVTAGFFSLCLGVYSVLGWCLGRAVPGWASVMAAVAFLSSLQFVMLGIIGEYLGRLYEESRSRPLFLEWERTGHGLGADHRVLS